MHSRDLESPLYGTGASRASRLVSTMHERLAGFVAHRLRERGNRCTAVEARDVTHDILVRVLGRRDDALPIDDAAGWAYLRTAAIRALADVTRRAARAPAVTLLGSDAGECAGPRPLDQVLGAEERDAVRAALGRLDARTALALRLRVGEGEAYLSIVRLCGYGTTAEARRAVRRGLNRISHGMPGRRAVEFVDRVRR